MTSSRKTGGWSPSGALSLFPFLAVLICVMGGLIVLLVVLARHGRVQAIRAAQAAVSQKKISLQELQQQRELLQWQAEQIQESRAKTEAQLAEARLQLSGAEDHLRRLRQELEELQRAWQAMKESASASEDPAQLEEQLRRLQAEIVRLKQEVAQKNQTEQKPIVSYAIIPYQGPHGTQRRPIYIECRQEAVILQPEGIVLTPRDFEGPITQENPLARAVRAAREYWANQAGSLPEAQEPYPLLLVRPDGIVAYYTAREALQEWGSEFGYELIGQDWQLRFPPADPQLAQILAQEVQLARARQELLAKIAPRVAGRARPLYRVGPRGIQLEDPGGGSGGAGRPGPGRFAQAHSQNKKPPGPSDAQTASDGPSGPSGLAKGSGWGGSAEGFTGQEPSASTGQPQLSQHQGGLGRSWALEGLAGGGPGKPGPGGEGAGEGHGGRTGLVRGSRATPDSQTLPGNGGPGHFGVASGSSGEIVGSGQMASGSPSGGFAMTPPMPAGPAGSGNLGSPGTGSFGPPTAAFPPEAGQAAGSFSAARQWGTGLSPPASEHPEAGGSPAGAASRRLRPGEWYDPPPTPPAESAPKEANSLAGKGSQPSKQRNSAEQLRSVRGRNWALPQAADKAIPITRPIQVECYPDRLVLAPGSPQKKEIPFGSKTLDSLDELVSAVWEHIEGWGIAGRGMYWRPVLSVRVAPGAEGRFQELQSLLEDSGLLIERRP